MEALSAILCRRIFGYDGYLCAEAAWRGGPLWRAFAVVVECFHSEPYHCDECLLRWVRYEGDVNREWAHRLLWALA